jgi:hypothetical protein
MEVMENQGIKGDGLVSGEVVGGIESDDGEMKTGLEDCPIEELTEQELLELEAGKMDGRGIGISGKEKKENGE